jgi:hypothetical protein
VTIFTFGFRLFFILLKINLPERDNFYLRLSPFFILLKINSPDGGSGPPHLPRSFREFFNPDLNGKLHWSNDMDKSLNEVASDRIRKYRADYNNNPNAVSFIPAIASTSGRVHSEFIKILFLQVHRETDIFLTSSGVQSEQSNMGVFLDTNHILKSTLTGESRQQKGDSRTCLLCGFSYFFRPIRARYHLGLGSVSKKVQRLPHSWKPNMLFPEKHNRSRYTAPVSLRKWIISKSFFC